MWRYFRVGSAIGAAGSRPVDVRVQALGGGAAAAGWQRNRLHSSVATNASLKAGRNSGFRQRPASSWVGADCVASARAEVGLPIADQPAPHCHCRTQRRTSQPAQQTSCSTLQPCLSALTRRCALCTHPRSPSILPPNHHLKSLSPTPNTIDSHISRNTKQSTIRQFASQVQLSTFLVPTRPRPTVWIPLSSHPRLANAFKTRLHLHSIAPHIHTHSHRQGRRP